MENNQSPLSAQHFEEFRPEKISRSGELNAWSLAVVFFAIYIVLSLGGYKIPVTLLILVVALFLAAILISCSNWVDHKTVITLSEDGIKYYNGLRHLYFAWNDIQAVQVTPSRWGNHVQVRSERNRFDFRTLGEVKYQGSIIGRTGFLSGEEILRTIVLKSGLEIAESLENGTYYVRR